MTDLPRSITVLDSTVGYQVGAVLVDENADYPYQSSVSDKRYNLAGEEQGFEWVPNLEDHTQHTPELTE